MKKVSMIAAVLATLVLAGCAPTGQNTPADTADKQTHQVNVPKVTEAAQSAAPAEPVTERAGVDTGEPEQMKGKPDPEALVDDWEKEIDFAAVMNRSVSEADAEKYLPKEPLPVRVHVSFGVDGSVAVALDRAELEAGLDAYLAGVREGFRAMYTDKAASEGKTFAEYAAGTKYGTAVAFLDAVTEQYGMGAKSVSANDTIVTNFLAKGERLYVGFTPAETTVGISEPEIVPEDGSSFMVYSIDGDTLWIDEAYGGDILGLGKLTGYPVALKSFTADGGK